MDFNYSIRWFFFLLSQLQFEDTIVVVDDVGQGRESVVMVEATFLNLLRIEKRAQGFRAVNDYGAIASPGNHPSRFLERCADSNPAGKSVAS